MPGVKRKMEASGAGPSRAGLHLQLEPMGMAEHTGNPALAEDTMDLQMDFITTRRYMSGWMGHSGLISELIDQNPMKKLSQEAMLCARRQMSNCHLSMLSRAYIEENGTEGLVESCFVFMKIMCNWLCNAQNFHCNTSAIFNRVHRKKTVVVEGLDNLGKSLIIRSMLPLANFYGEAGDKIQQDAMNKEPIDHRMLLVEDPGANYLHALEDAGMAKFPLFITTSGPADWKNGSLQNDGYFVDAINGSDLHKFNGNMHPGVWYIIDKVCDTYTGRYDWRSITKLTIEIAMNVNNRYHACTESDNFTNTTCSANEHIGVYLSYCKKYAC